MRSKSRVVVTRETDSPRQAAPSERIRSAASLALLVGSGLLLNYGTASAQAATTAAQDDNVLEQIIVTGTRVTGRTVKDSAAPIDLVGPQELEKANKANLLETLNSALPSFNLPNVATPDIGSMVRGAQLRGFNPDHTLVLVNGKRRHSTAFLGAGGFGTSAPADLSLIPTGAIQRIEVLRDGASALYGSDAIAGVINIITNKADKGGSASYRYGRYFRGDGQTQVAKLDVGSGLGSDGYIHLSAQFDDQRIVIRNSPIPSTFLFYFPLNAAGQQIAPSGNLSSNPTLPVGATPNPKEATRNNRAWINQGHAPYKLYSGTLDAGKPIGADAEWYGTATIAHRDSSAPQNFRQPIRDEVVRAIYPDGFTPVETIDESDFELIGGVRKQTGYGWDWDVSADYGKNANNIGVENSDNPTFGLQSQTSFFIGNLSYKVLTLNADVRRQFQWGGRPLDFSAGLESRNENYKRSHGDYQSYSWGGAKVLDGPRAGTTLGLSLGGSQALPGYRPEDVVDQNRNSQSAYVGLSLKLTPAWVTDLAARFEHYSDFGSTSTGRLSTRYDFNRKVALRATVSNGFHAPALAALAYKNTGNQNTFVNHVLQVTSPQAVALGAKPLEPEKSTNLSLGLVLNLPHDVSVALDAYQIDLKNRIAQSTVFRQDLYPGAGTLVAAAGFPAADGISYFINAADTRSRGLEATLEGRFDLQRYGALRWSLAGSFSNTDVTHIAATPPALAALNIPVFSLGSQRNLKYLAPTSKEALSLGWSKSRLGVNLRETHYGQTQRYGTPATVATTGPYAGLTEIPYDIGALWVTDLDIDFNVTHSFKVNVAVNNLFDVKPAKLPAPLLSAWQSYSYTNNGPIGAEGGFYSLTLKYGW